MSTKKVILLVGVPCSGKSWITSQLHDEFTVMEQDDFIGQSYFNVVREALKHSQKPIITNTPFGMSELMASLEQAGAEVEPVYVIDHPDTLQARYMARNQRALPQGHLTRQLTYMDRAKDTGAFWGTSEQVLKHLRSKP
jgi:gluconate kinase